MTNRDEQGATAIEYALMVAAIAAVIVVIVFAIGRLTSGAYTTTCDSLEDGEFSGSHSCP